VNIRVGLLERRSKVRVEFRGRFREAGGADFGPGDYEFVSPVRLSPTDPARDRFVLPDVTIGIGFHWERRQKQTFGGSFEVEATQDGLTLINEVPIEDYVESVIGSEMNAASPIEFLKAHAVISRSWVASQVEGGEGEGTVRRDFIWENGEREVVAWYGREAHTRFDVCADDHCQRYQGVGQANQGSLARAVRETEAEYLTFDGRVCDARFSKCCGGITEDFEAAWDEEAVPYLRAVRDWEGNIPFVDEVWMRSAPRAWCNTSDRGLLGRLLPGFDQETTDFFRWTQTYGSGELGELVRARTGVALGAVIGLDPLERGASGRIVRLRIRGASDSLIVGKELEIRKVLSDSHLYSSAFVADFPPGKVVLYGAGWGHGVGLCQIGAGVLADQGWTYGQILAHYYPEANLTMGFPARALDR